MVILEKRIDKSNFWLLDTVTGAGLNWTFWNKLIIDRWCSISKSVNHVSYQGSNASQDLYSVNFIFDFNGQVRMCCEVLLRLCDQVFCSLFLLVTKSVFNRYFLGHVFLRFLFNAKSKVSVFSCLFSNDAWIIEEIDFEMCFVIINELQWFFRNHQCFLNIIPNHQWKINWTAMFKNFISTLYALMISNVCIIAIINISSMCFQCFQLGELK